MNYMRFLYLAFNCACRAVAGTGCAAFALVRVYTYGLVPVDVNGFTLTRRVLEHIDCLNRTYACAYAAADAALNICCCGKFTSHTATCNFLCESKEADRAVIKTSLAAIALIIVDER
jgi:hypothetical protein